MPPGFLPAALATRTDASDYRLSISNMLTRRKAEIKTNPTPAANNTWPFTCAAQATATTSPKPKAIRTRTSAIFQASELLPRSRVSAGIEVFRNCELNIGHLSFRTLSGGQKPAPYRACPLLFHREASVSERQACIARGRAVIRLQPVICKLLVVSVVLPPDIPLELRLDSE